MAKIAFDNASFQLEVELHKAPLCKHQSGRFVTHRGIHLAHDSCGYLQAKDERRHLQWFDWPTLYFLQGIVSIGHDFVRTCKFYIEV